MWPRTRWMQWSAIIELRSKKKVEDQQRQNTAHNHNLLNKSKYTPERGQRFRIHGKSATKLVVLLLVLADFVVES